MKHHVKVYCDFFGYIDHSEIVCEMCLNPANDVHHIEPRQMGGSKLKDVIENLFGLCREHHDLCEHGGVSREEQKQIHLSFMKAFKAKWVTVRDIARGIANKTIK